MALSELEKSHLVIHSCAVIAAGWSGVWGTVPVFGVTVDTPGLIAITGVMGGLLGTVFGKRFGEIDFAKFAAAALQYFSGALLIKWASSLIPFFGTAVNASISLATVEAVGWALYLIYSEGVNLPTLTGEKIKEYLRRGESLQAKFEETREFAWIDELPSSVKSDYKKLTDELGATGTTDERRAAILEEIERLLAPYRPDGQGGSG